MIDIVCCIDNNYTEYCGVTLSSIFTYTPDERFCIHIICNGEIEKTKKEKLSNYVKRHGSELLFYKILPETIEKFPMKETDHLSFATYLRLFMSELLPDNIDKVLYLDCDIIVIDSLKSLWETNIDDVAVAAVEDAAIFDAESFKRLNYPKEYSYFNAGVLLVNLKKWREHNFSNMFREYIAKYPERIVFHDQDVLNSLLYKDKKFLNLRWNLIDVFLLKSPLLHPYRKQEWEAAIKNPGIIHFTGALKPWKYKSDNPFTILYHLLARKNGWDVMPKKWMYIYILRYILYRVQRKYKTLYINTWKWQRKV